MSGKKLAIIAAIVGVGAMAGSAYADNVTASRHNLSRLTFIPGVMANGSFEQFNEVCVYCHTPHGANKNVQAPLWNRIVNTSGTYTPYNSSTIDTSPGQPIGVSLACLSCHDGTIALDNIVNAPGSGNYFPGGKNPVPGPGHLAMNNTNCGSCHNGTVGHDARAAYLGTDLTSTHPISMIYPTLTGADPKFFPPGINGAFTNGVKLYNGRVECPSCHNPHLGDADYATSPGKRPFLRVSNEGSDLCTTCHIK